MKNELFLEVKKETGKTNIEVVHKFLKEEKAVLVESSKLEESFLKKLCLKQSL